MDGDLIDERLSRASTIPAAWYSDPRMLESERREIFARTWQLAGLLSNLKEPGDYLTTEIGGEPLILVRDAARQLRALSNVCRHRAGPVARGNGNRRSFRCGYHGWTWSLEGNLLHCPEFEGAEGFDPASVRLPEVRVESWGPLLFVNLHAEAAPLRDWMREVIERTAHITVDTMTPVERRDYVVQCNWKVYVDNYLEGYHIPIVHPSLYREIDYDAYRTEVFRNASEQVAPLRDSGGLSRRYAQATGAAGEALYFWIFPNLMLNVYPDNVSTNLVVPVAPNRTVTIFEWLFRDPEVPATREALRRTVSFSDEIQQEDISICEAVQRGLESRSYERGRFSVKREGGVHHFHRLLSQYLSEPPGP